MSSSHSASKTAHFGPFGAVSVLEMNHADLKIVLFLCQQTFFSDCEYGIMKLKIEIDESDMRGGSR